MIKTNSSNLKFRLFKCDIKGQKWGVWSTANVFISHCAVTTEGTEQNRRTSAHVKNSFNLARTLRNNSRSDQINWRQSPPINSSNCWTSEATAWNTSSDVNVWAEHWRMCVNDTTLTGWCRCSQNLQNLQTNKTQCESRTSSVMTGESEAFKRSGVGLSL